MTKEEKIQYVDEFCDSKGDYLNDCNNCPLDGYEYCWNGNVTDEELSEMVRKVSTCKAKELKTKSLQEKIKFVTGFCADMDSCLNCPCLKVGNCDDLSIIYFTDKAMDAMISAISGEDTTYDPETDEEIDLVDIGKEPDMVNAPPHYASTSIECIDAMRETQGDDAVYHFCLCNAFKYLWRHNKKNGYEDVKKANWYLNKAVEIFEDKN